jgi:LPXTG-motif cell wall-anchored protein
MMKKSVLVFSMTVLLFLSGFNMAIAQEQPAPKKDTVNMDTDAKPEFYYAIEDEESMEGPGKGISTAVVIIIGAVVVVGAAAFFLLKKKK